MILNKVKGKLAYWKRGVAFFACQPEKNHPGSNHRDDIQYLEITEASQLLKFEVPQEHLAAFQDRLHRNEIFCVLAVHREILCYGWLNLNDTHYIGEINLNMEHRGRVEVLYNFETLPRFRGKGLYPYLLSNIAMRNGRVKFIYALTDNISSIRGIRKAGFVPLGNVYGFNKGMFKKILKNLWAD
ncbi:MAG: hypothetical protein KA289_00060 [Kaistella sp.]|nr:hypothetical protein [Kaistella sp.]